MPSYRRFFVPGGTYFFTVVTAQRHQLFRDPEAASLLGRCLREVRSVRPFTVVAIILMPDHLHTIWTLPEGDSDYSTRWGAIKASFSRAWAASGGQEASISASQQHEGRRGVWQQRFMEHTILDEADLEAHVDYIHYNPVKHGLAASPAEWPWSSFPKYVRDGHYPPSWGSSQSNLPTRLPQVRDDLLE